MVGGADLLLIAFCEHAEIRHANTLPCLNGRKK